MSPRINSKLLESQVKLGLIDATAVILVEKVKHLLDKGFVECWRVPLIVQALRKGDSDHIRLLVVYISADGHQSAQNGGRLTTTKTQIWVHEGDRLLVARACVIRFSTKTELRRERCSCEAVKGQKVSDISVVFRS